MELKFYFIFRLYIYYASAVKIKFGCNPSRNFCSYAMSIQLVIIVRRYETTGLSLLLGYSEQQYYPSNKYLAILYSVFFWTVFMLIEKT